jgi:flavin-dependent dehydrogenase
VRADLEQRFSDALAKAPSLAERLPAGRREERFHGATDLANFFRQAWGPGWALVGDASCHKDPFLALGMCDALRDAELLATALLDAACGVMSHEEAMMRYARARYRASSADYRENLRQAALAPAPSSVLRLRAALRANPEQATRFYLAREGLIPPETFFNTANLVALIGDDVPAEQLSEFSRKEVARVGAAA